MLNGSVSSHESHIFVFTCACATCWGIHSHVVKDISYREWDRKPDENFTYLSGDLQMHSLNLSSVVVDSFNGLVYTTLSRFCSTSLS